MSQVLLEVIDSNIVAIQSALLNGSDWATKIHQLDTALRSAKKFGAQFVYDITKGIRYTIDEAIKRWDAAKLGW